MKPAKFEVVNLTYTRPENMTDEECGSLPVHQYERGIISCWKLSFCERVKVIFTGRVWLDVAATRQPPVWLGVNAPNVATVQQNFTIYEKSYPKERHKQTSNGFAI